MNFTFFDEIVFFVLLFFVILGIWRGMIASVLSLTGWFLAFLIVTRYVEWVMPLMPADLPGGERTRWFLSSILLMCLVLIVTHLISEMLTKFASLVGLGGIDRLLGGLFGLAKGAFFVCLIVVALSFANILKQPFWKQSFSRPYILSIVNKMQSYLPERVASYIRL